MGHLFTNIYFIVIFMLFNSQIGDATVAKDWSHMMINATPACKGQFPFVVSVRFGKLHMCGGTILTEKWILTAAHCTYQKSRRSKLTVVFGLNKIVNGVRMGHNEINVKKIIEHDKFKRIGFFQNDIALLKLEKDLKWSDTVWPMRLTTDYLNKGAKGEVTGWARAGGSFYLQYSTVEVFTDDYCSEKHSNLINNYIEICVGVHGKAKCKCDGDSGGPFVVAGYLAGISSWIEEGLSCKPDQNPAVYTYVPIYVNWISHTTGISFIDE